MPETPEAPGGCRSLRQLRERVLHHVSRVVAVVNKPSCSCERDRRETSDQVGSCPLVAGAGSSTSRSQSGSALTPVETHPDQ